MNRTNPLNEMGTTSEPYGHTESTEWAYHFRQKPTACSCCDRISIKGKRICALPKKAKVKIFHFNSTHPRVAQILTMRDICPDRGILEENLIQSFVSYQPSGVPAPQYIRQEQLLTECPPHWFLWFQLALYAP